MTNPHTPLSPGGPSFSWVAELLQRIPGHSLMAGLFVYCFFHVIPEKEAWYWAQMEKQRQELAATRVAYEDRKEAQVREVVNQCLSIAQANSATLKDILAQVGKCGHSGT